MEILRVPPYSIEAVINVSSASEEYDYTILDMVEQSETSGTVTSDSSSKVTIELPSNIDNSYLITIDEEEVLVDVVRPYVDANDKGDTASEIAEYKSNEELARAIIDSVVSQGFYYKKDVIQISGNGSDYIPVWKDVKKILKVYENNVLVYDYTDPDSYERSFELTKDKTAIIQSYGDTINRVESAPVIIPLSSSDSGAIIYYTRSFPKGVDYTIFVETGYKNIPSDIVKATELLIEDIKCGKLEYYKRYATSYNTDQFKISFDDKLFEGTGNILVDKILSKYSKSIQTLGVL